MNSILVIAEIVDQNLAPITFELVSAAQEAARLSNLPEKSVSIVVPAEDPEKISLYLAEKTGLDTIGIKGIKSYTSLVYIDNLVSISHELNPSIIFAAHTSQGRDFLPGLAVALNACSAAGVNGMVQDDQDIVFIRPVFGGEKQMHLRHDPQSLVVASVMQGAFSQTGTCLPKKGSCSYVLALPEKKEDRRITHIQIKKPKVDNQALKAARVVVSVGRGIGEKENLGLVREFVEKLPNAALGASRPLVDMGWIGYEHQVGITGTTVSPDIYIALGISGSSQHLAGMKSSKVVVAVNQNKEAPIFGHADLCVVEDAVLFLKELISQMTEKSN